MPDSNSLSTFTVKRVPSESKKNSDAIWPLLAYDHLIVLPNCLVLPHNSLKVSQNTSPRHGVCKAPFPIAY